MYSSVGIPLAPILGEKDICAHGPFCTKFNSEQLLFKSFFDVMRIFGSIEPQSVSFPFPYIIHYIQIYTLIISSRFFSLNYILFSGLILCFSVTTHSM